MVPPARRLRGLCAHLRPGRASTHPAAATPAPDEGVVPLAPLELPSDDREGWGQRVVDALRADGCALIPATIPPATAAEMAALLTTYTPGTAGTGLTTKEREHAPRRTIQFGGDVELFGATGQAELLLTLFNRDPRWLQVLDPFPIAEAVDIALADGNPSAVHRSRNLPHLVNQSGWRNHPGHRSGGLHVGELFLTATELPPELLSGFPEWEPPMQILTALTYLVDVDADLCPTVVVACATPTAATARVDSV